MSEKPVFGPQADIDEDATDKATSGPATKPVFGVNAAIEEPEHEEVAEAATSGNQPRFGVDAAADTNATKVTTFGERVKQIFAMQPASFWFKQYGFAFLGFFLMVSNEMSPNLALINMLLYPFTVSILQEVGRKREHVGTIGAFFFGFSVGMIGQSIWYIVFYGVIRLLIFMLKFSFSVVIGLFGLIYMATQAKKLY